MTLNTTMARILELNSMRGSTDSTLERDLGLPPKTISNWKRQNSNACLKILPKLADYFDVSVDYLLGRTDDPSPYPNQNLNIPQDIANVQFAFYDGDKDELTQEDIDDIAKYVRYMREKRRKENESKK